MRVLVWIAAGLTVVGVAMASGAAGPRSADASCGHVEELLAAKRALEAGDKEAALRHLKNADALLSICIRYGIPAAPQGGEEVSETKTG